MKIFLRVLVGLVVSILAVFVTAVASTPGDVLKMSQQERYEAAQARKAAEQQHRHERTARLVCAQRLGIPHNNDWRVEVKGNKYVVQGGMCRMTRELVE